jgi:3-oxoadipate enol-lactonase
MPMINVDGCPINVEIEGAQNAPVLMLSNSLGTNIHMWDDHMPALLKHFRVLRYDRRGHGKSGTSKGPYTMEQLGRDVLAILGDLGIKKINWCGLSMGGMVGQWLGANAPERIEKLILSNNTAYYADKQPWNDRIRYVRAHGLASIVGPNMERWFTKEFRERSPQTIERMTEMFLATSLDGYIACGEAVRDMDHRALLSKISVPTLVIAGRHDSATPPDHGQHIADRIRGATFTIVDGAHIANVEQPDVYSNIVLEFLTKQ